MLGSVTLFYYAHEKHHSPWKTQSGKPRVWAEPSEPQAPLLNSALSLAHGIIALNNDLV